MQNCRTLKSASQSYLFNSRIKAFVQQGNYNEALKFYASSLLHASTFTYPYLLKACALLPSLENGKKLHSNIITTGLFSVDDAYISSSLITMYVKCSSFSHALRVFDNLPESGASVRDVAVWNSVIDGYVRFGLNGDALLLFRQMLSLRVRPDAYSLCIILGECDLLQGKQVHGYVVRNMFYSDAFLESSLLHMYFRFGCTVQAWRLFKEIEDKSNVVLWNVMIDGFSENGLCAKSLKSYVLARNENVKLVTASFAAILIACCLDKYLIFGKQVHSDLIKMGFDNDSYVATSLLTMYGKCRLIQSAERVFGEAWDKRTELWNSMISGYACNGLALDVLQIYREMKLYEISPDSITMSNVLASCSAVGSFEFGRSIHAELIKRPMQVSVSAQTALLTLYAKHGSDIDAASIFSSMKEKDVVAWGSIISGFCQNRKYDEALGFFKDMEANGIKPDSDIITSVISACTGLSKVEMGCLIHAFVIKNGIEQDVFIASSLIDMYSKCGFPDMAGNVFSDMPRKNLVAWNSMIYGYCKNGLPEHSINLFTQMVENGLNPDSVSITTMLAAVSYVAALLKGKALHGFNIRQGLPSDLQLDNALIDMYIKCGSLKYAQHIFQNMSERNLVTWNSMVGGYGSHGKCLEAMRLFEEMIRHGITPDDISFLCLLSSCNHSGLVEEGLDLFDLMSGKYGIKPRMEHYVNIVDILGRMGRIHDAHTFIKNMPIEADRSVWLSLLSSCRAHRNVELGLVAADELLKVEPSRGGNYIPLLNLYGEAALWDTAASLRTSMKENGVKKNPGCSWIEVRDKLHVFFSADSSLSTHIHETLGSLWMIMGKKSANLETDYVLYFC